MKNQKLPGPDGITKEFYKIFWNDIKRIYLSKALTCMKFFCINKKCFFHQGDGYLWPHCCMNNLYISHRSLYAPTYSFWAIGSMLINLFRVTSRFDTVYNIVTRWVNFENKHLNEHEQQLSDYTIFRSILTKINVFLVLFTIFHLDLEKFIIKNCKYKCFYQKFVHFGLKYF